ncbi:MAG: FHA domain-containing protein [Isosphaeraceae bacterium]
MATSLTIGSRPDCDLVLRSRTVSGRHCRLSRDTAGFILEDLNSTNGTFFNGERVLGSMPINLTPGDTIHLGSHPLSADQILRLFDQIAAPTLTPTLSPTPTLTTSPTPTFLVRADRMLIGRSAECDQVVDLPVVSSRHARIFRSGGQFLIEDLGSSNGTYVNGDRIVGPVVVNHGDRIALGSAVFVLDTNSWKPEPEDLGAGQSAAPLPEPAAPSAGQMISVKSVEQPETSGILSHPWRLAGLFLQSPLLSLLIAGLLGNHSPAPVLFSVALAVIWFGLTNALLSGLMDQRVLRAELPDAGAPELLSRLVVLAGLCGLQCLVSWGIVASIAALQAPAGPALGFLVLAATVGMALGLVGIALAPRANLAGVLLLAPVLLLLLLGGWPSLLRLPVVPALSPSRWAFEGLLLLESSARPENDLAQAYFPAESLRMGETADALALAFMLFGLLAAVAFMATSTRSRQPGLPASPPADT